MKILGIDTSTSVASVAIMEDDKLIGEMTLNDKKTHSQKLMLLIEELMKQTNHQFSDLDAIAIGIGPGSFTGLRIGVTTAKGLAHGANLPLIEVSSLEILKHQLFIDSPICAMMDSRRSTVFMSFYNTDSQGEDQIHIDDVIQQCAALKSIHFIGDGALLHKEKLVEALGEKAKFVPGHLNQISAGSLCSIAMAIDERHAYDDIHVTYLRKSQAEREYDERHSL